MRSFFEILGITHLMNDFSHYFFVSDDSAALDYPAAIALYEQGIAKGDTDAMHKRGSMHKYGQGGPIDYAAAIALYDQAIAKGHASAMYSRANMHKYGQGGPIDYTAAIALYEQAIAKGHAPAMYGRGYMHHYGLGGPVDYAAAIALYEQAIAKGSPDAMNNRASMHKNGHGGSVDYPAAIALYEQAIAKGNPYAMHNRAYMHHYGQGGPVDYPAAIALYEQAIVKGSQGAMHNRGYMHHYGVGGPVNYPAAIALYDQAIAKGNTLAMNNRAQMHRDGQGGPVDYPAAIALYEQAIANENTSAMNNRAKMHQYGQGGPIDYPAAIALYEQAIDKGNVSAVSALVSLLEAQAMVIDNAHAVGAINQDDREHFPNMLLMFPNNPQQPDGHNDSAMKMLTKKALNLVLKYTSIQKPENLNPNIWINYWFKKAISPQHIHAFMVRTLDELGVVYDVEDPLSHIELSLACICESKTFQAFLEQEKASIANQVTLLNEDLTHAQRKTDSLFFEELVCPITQEVMHHPVIIDSGICYEHAEILNWLEQKSICPATNQKANKNIIITDFRLKSFCDRYWESAENREKIHRKIDVKNKEFDLLNNFKKEVILAYEGSDLIYEKKSGVACRIE